MFLHELFFHQNYYINLKNIQTYKLTINETLEGSVFYNIQPTEYEKDLTKNNSFDTKNIY